MNLCLIDPFKQSDVPETVEYYLVDPKNIKSNCASFNRRGTLLAVGCASPIGKILVWDFDTKKIVRTLYHHTGCVNSICWSRNGKKLLTASNDGSLVLWDLATSKILFSLELESPILFAEFHPRNNDLCLIVLQKGTDPILLNFKSSEQTPLNIKSLVTSYIKREETLTGIIPTSVNSNYNGLATFASFNRRGEKIFFGDSCGMISVLDFKSMTIDRQFKVASSNTTVKQIEFSRNHRFMLVSSSDKVLRLISLESTNLYQQMREYQDSVNRMHWKKCCFSSNNEYVVGGMNHKSIHSIFIWSVSGSLVKDLEGPKEGLVDVIWHPLRPIIVSISFTGVIYVWTAYFEENWSSFAPDFQELEENLDYVEDEDEFDAKDSDNENQEVNNNNNNNNNNIGRNPYKKIKTQQELNDKNSEEEEFVDVDHNDRITEFSSDEEEDLFCFSAIDDRYVSNVKFDDPRHPLYEKYQKDKEDSSSTISNSTISSSSSPSSSSSSSTTTTTTTTNTTSQKKDETQKKEKSTKKERNSDSKKRK
ncbi:hypothetical protein ACTFIW_013137 [Dictyostelium discoideum]